MSDFISKRAKALKYHSREAGHIIFGHLVEGQNISIVWSEQTIKYFSKDAVPLGFLAVLDLMLDFFSHYSQEELQSLKIHEFNYFLGGSKSKNPLSSEKIEFILPLFEKLRVLHVVKERSENPPQKWKDMAWNEQFSLLSLLSAQLDCRGVVNDFDYKRVWLSSESDKAIKMKNSLIDLFQDSDFSVIIGA